MRKLIVSILAVFSILACQQKFDKHWDLSIDSQAYTVSYKDTVLNVTVWCSDAWTAELTSGQDWARLNKSTGSGIAHLKVCFNENEGLQRGALLKLVSGQIVKEIAISQRAAIAAPKLMFEKPSLSYPSGNFLVRVSYITNLPDKVLESIDPVVKYESGDGWITEIVKTDIVEDLDPSMELPDCKRHFMEFKINANDSGTLRKAIVYMGISDASEQVFETELTLSQLSEASKIILPQSDKVGRDGGSKSLTVDTNIPLDRENLSVSVAYPDASLSGFLRDVSVVGNVLTYNVSVNDSGSERKAVITLSHKDAAGTLTESSMMIVQGIEMTSFDNCEIRSADELMLWRASIDKWKPTDKIRLISDIDMAGRKWEPVDFEGTFDGQGHCIKNIRVENNGPAGFFRHLNGNAVVKNVTFGTKDDNSCFIANAAESGSYSFAAPIIKIRDNSSVENIVNYADVILSETCTDGSKGNLIAGLLASHSSSGVVKGCINHGNVIVSAKLGNFLDLGGICGEVIRDGDLVDCKNYGLVEMKADKNISCNVGGVVGFLNSKSVISGCENSGIVRVDNNCAANFKLYIGGIIGVIGSPTASKAIAPEKIIACHNLIGGDVVCKGSKAGETFLGGVVGYVLNAVSVSFSDCSNAAEVRMEANLPSVGSGYNYPGGFAGQIKGNDCKIMNCTNTGNVYNTGLNTAGSLRMAGFVGAVGSAGVLIDGCKCSGIKVSNSVSLGGASNGIGGLTGTVTGRNMTIKNSICENVTLSTANGKSTYCAMFVAYVSNSGTIVANNGASGIVNSVTLTDGSLAAASLFYNASSTASGTLKYSGTYIIK